VGYDREIAILEIEFTNGAVYEYDGVPEEIYADLLAAESKGAYFDALHQGWSIFVQAVVVSALAGQPATGSAYGMALPRMPTARLRFDLLRMKSKRNS
jgi:hypothetical protein